MTSRYVLALLKGLIEHGDPSRHFGLEASFLQHKKSALDAGLIEQRGDVLVATQLGRDIYNEHQLSAMPQGRASLWLLPRDD